MEPIESKFLVCAVCKKQKPRAAFGNHWIARNPMGLPKCTKCYQEQMKFDNMNQKIRTLAHKALKIGEIKKPVRCDYCRSIKKLDMHHINYTHPTYDLLWLCRSCHGKWHNYGL